MNATLTCKTVTSVVQSFFNQNAVVSSRVLLTLALQNLQNTYHTGSFFQVGGGHSRSSCEIL